MDRRGFLKALAAAPVIPAVSRITPVAAAVGASAAPAVIQFSATAARAVGLMVFINGVLKQEADYSVSADGTITFSKPPLTGDFVTAFNEEIRSVTRYVGNGATASFRMGV